MAIGTQQRDQQARKLVEEWLEAAKTVCGSESERGFAKERRILEDLIPVNAAGFRGVVITAIVGKALNASFNPTTDFYACNPRSIFEKGIYYALVGHGVPCGKSDPLNVAKNVQVIDANWATGRRPESAAMAAVAYISLVHENWPDLKYRQTLIRLFFERLWAFAVLCQSKNRPLAAFEGEAPATLALRLAQFVDEYTEGGATPQFVIGILIRELRLDDRNFKSVEGVNESVFGTNTTSKKPADIWEVLSDGSLGSLYEITAKPIDIKRLDDCIQSLQNQRSESRLINFICRMPDDIKLLSLNGPVLLHGGMVFQFLDIKTFTIIIFCLLRPVQQAAVIRLVDDYVKDTNRKGRTKDGWASLFGQTESI